MKKLQEKIKNIKTFFYSIIGGQFKKRQETTFSVNDNYNPKYVFDSDIELLSFLNRKIFNDMLKNTKTGNSSESIADGIFDRIGFSTKVLREDDYGIDYLCSVGKDFGCSIYPTKTFVSQLKSNFDPIIYDLSINGKNNWLIENNIPLFFCIYEAKEGLLYFYSASMINDFTIRNYKNVNKIEFKFRKPDDNACVIHLNGKLAENNDTYSIDCGIPFMSISVLETNIDDSDKFDNYRKILEKLITKDNENITYKNLGLPFMSWMHQYKMNDSNILFGWADYSDDKIISSKDLLNRLYQPIITLCSTYYHENKIVEYEKMKTFVDLIDYNDRTKSVLENMGFRDNNGNVIDR